MVLLHVNGGGGERGEAKGKKSTWKSIVYLKVIYYRKAENGTNTVLVIRVLRSVREINVFTSAAPLYNQVLYI